MAEIRNSDVDCYVVTTQDVAVCIVGREKWGGLVRNDGSNVDISKVYSKSCSIYLKFILYISFIQFIQILIS